MKARARTALAKRIARASGEAHFKGRRGHGGAPVTSRVLARAELEAIVEAAVRVALERCVEATK